MPDWDDDPGDGNASDYDRAMSSGDDEEDGHTKQGKLPRYQYPTFKAGEDDDGDSIEDDEFSGQKRSKMTHEERTYGVFYTEGMSSEDDGAARPKPNQNSKRNQKRKPFFKSSSFKPKVTTAPLFVKGDVLQPREEDRKIGGQEPPIKEYKAQDQDNKSDGNISKDSSSGEADVAAIERKKRVEESDQHFLDLLRKGTTRQATARSFDEIISHESKHDETRRDGSSAFVTTPRFRDAGLAFRSSGEDAGPINAGLGFREESSSSGLGFQSSGKPDEAPSMVSSGLGFGTFGPKRTLPEQKKRPTLDPNLGKWEKHTKGIGAKLLAKMGYSGKGGLGSKKRKLGEIEVNSATGPIQVKVRPANLGLGFGGFKEATHLNKEQEAKAKQKGETKPKEDSQFPNINRSAIPNVRDLLKDESSWRAAPSEKRKSDTKQKPKIVTYKELLDQQNELSKGIKILDLRGPQMASEGLAEEIDSSVEPPLAEELLHNVSLLVGTHESKLYSVHQMESASQLKLVSMQADSDSLSRQKRELKQRYDKMTMAISILDEIESLELKGRDALPKVKPLLQKLSATFTRDERNALQFSQSILPSLLYPVLDEDFGESWDPLGHSIARSEKLIRSTFDAVLPALSQENEDEKQKTVTSIWVKFILPRTERVLQESDWVGHNGVVEQCAALYDLLQRIAIDMSKPSKKSVIDTDSEQHVLPLDEDDIIGRSPDDSSLLNLVQRQLIHNMVQPKLLRCLSSWKPSLNDAGRGLHSHLDQLVLPWIPYLDHHGLLPPLLQDCRTKLKAALSFLQKNLEGKDFLEQAMRVVRPWRGILKTKYMEEMVTTYITNKLARGLAKERPVMEERKQDWTLVNLLFRLHGDGLILTVEFLSIVEGELLILWCHAMYEWVQDGSGTMDVDKLVTDHYLVWKKQLLGGNGVPNNDTKYVNSQRVLREDTVVCKYFYAMLLMIQQAKISGAGMGVPIPPMTNYHVVISRRTTEERQKAAEELARMDVVSGTSGMLDPTTEARVRLAQHDHSRTPTFREVVAEFARERGILFQPRLGDKTTQVDGKQVFLFGSIPIYLDSNVVYKFTNDTKEWEPIALDDLGARASS